MKSIIKLRPYQEKLVEDIRDQIRSGNNRILVWAVTGAGKTAIAAHIVRSAYDKGKTVYFNCHRKELIYQTSEAFNKNDIPHSFVAAGMNYNPSDSVQICSVPTLYRRIDGVKTPDIIIWDETHFLGAKSWTDIFNKFPNSIHIGLSATPCRSDRKGLGDYYNVIVKGPSYSELMDLGFISRYKYYAPQIPDLSHVKTSMGDFNIADLAAEMNKPKLVGDAVREYKKLCDGKKAIIFAVNVEHSKSICDEFNLAGIPALHIDGTIDAQSRKKIISDFRSGRIKVLVNCEILTTGFDIPDIDACFLMRPTQSLALYIQMVGRALRPADGKPHAIIIDMAGNVTRHGLPDDDREWSLEGLPKRNKKNNEPSIKICEQCFAANENFSRFCTNCGHEFKVKPRSEIKKEDGDLVEVDKLLLKKHKKQEQAMAKTLDELVELGKKRGYKNARYWAESIYKSRRVSKN